MRSYRTAGGVRVPSWTRGLSLDGHHHGESNCGHRPATRRASGQRRRIGGGHHQSYPGAVRTADLDGRQRQDRGGGTAISTGPTSVRRQLPQRHPFQDGVAPAQTRTCLASSRRVECPGDVGDAEELNELLVPPSPPKTHPWPDGSQLMLCRGTSRSAPAMQHTHCTLPFGGRRMRSTRCPVGRAHRACGPRCREQALQLAPDVSEARCVRTAALQIRSRWSRSARVLSGAARRQRGCEGGRVERSGPLVGIEDRRAVRAEHACPQRQVNVALRLQRRRRSEQLGGFRQDGRGSRTGRRGRGRCESG